jgi:aminoglycoside/choline kinase family phosphotransferase/dTDP-glucose pyrophosphorylase
MKALLLAAGLGTRLRPHTHSLPKPLFPIGGEPLLAQHLRILAQAGVTSVAINTHHLHALIDNFLAEREWGLEIVVSHEPEILGTGGAMKQLAGFWGKAPFLVINADVVCNLDLVELCRVHRKAGPLATLVMHEHERFDTVAVDGSGRIRMMPPRSLEEAPKDSRLMAFTGIHVIDPQVLEVIPAGGPYSIIDAYQDLLDQGGRLDAHLPTSNTSQAKRFYWHAKRFYWRAKGFYWRDIGTPDQYRLTAYEQLAPLAFETAFADAPHDIDAVEKIPLAGDGSDRRWYRLASGNHRLILADHGLREQKPPAEADAYVAIGRHLRAKGVCVPAIYLADPFSGLVFCEDLGDENLQARAETLGGSARLEACYQRVIDRLLDLGIDGATDFDPAWTYQTAAYDHDLILSKECRYFLEAFINGYLGLEVAEADLAAEFESLAATLMDNSVPGLVHRDMQARNIMLQDDDCYFIDYQGARFGPLQYDIAALLIDPYVGLSQAVQERLFAYFENGIRSRLCCAPHRLERGYRLCRIARNLQILGAFAFLSREKAKPGFEAHIPAAAASLVVNLSHPAVPPTPRLTALATRAVTALNTR